MLNSKAFYDVALAPLNIARHVEYGGTALLPANVGYGTPGNCYFWLVSQQSTSGYLHVAFAAGSQEQVDAFYRDAIAAGGTDNGSPGFRPHYHENYYAAYVLDPDGVNVEAVHFPQP